MWVGLKQARVVERSACHSAAGVEELPHSPPPPESLSNALLGCYSTASYFPAQNTRSARGGGCHQFRAFKESTTYGRIRTRNWLTVPSITQFLLFAPESSQGKERIFTMKLGVLTLLFGERPLEETLDYVKTLGVQAVEFGTGGYVKAAHSRAEDLLNDESKVDWLKKAAADRDLIISALSCHGNPLHPDPKIAQAHHEDFVNSCQLAEKLGVRYVNGISGCPGSDPTAKFPNWITCPIPPEDFRERWEWQWSEKVIPYWKDAAAIADKYGVRIGIEMVPNNVVYNVETLLKLRDAVGETLGANLDPSHLFWQGTDIGAVIRKLGSAIYHFHAKDSAVNPYVVQLNGILDAKDLTDESNRSWIFRTVGYGHDQLAWNDIITQLRMAGYDFVVSIEHEDSLMSPDEGLEKAIDLLKRCLIQQKPGVAYWAQ